MRARIGACRGESAANVAVALQLSSASPSAHPVGAETMLKAKTAEKTLLAAAMLGMGLAAATAPAALAKQQGSAASVGAASAPTQSEATSGLEAPGSTASEPSQRTVKEEAIAYDGVSIATIFGPGLFGRHTACGQLLSKQVVGVANRTLPCGTLISVTYHGRRLTVPVIDRGPYGPLHANWDLTLGAARLLHITETTDIKAKIAGHVKNTPVLGMPGEEGLLTGAPAAPQPVSGTTGGVSSS